jgi:hypothetical protein
MANQQRSEPSKKITLTRWVFERLVPDEWYVGKLINVVESRGQFGEYYRLEFKILNGQTEKGKPAKGQRQSLFINKPTADEGKIAVTKKSKICRLIKAFGINTDSIFDNNEDLNIDFGQFVGEKLRIYIEDGDKINDDGYPQQRISSFMRYKKKTN